MNLQLRRQASGVGRRRRRAGALVASSTACMRATACLLALWCLLVSPSAASAQEIRAAISPDTITVGDVAQVGIRVTAPPTAAVSLPDSLPLTGDLENAGRPDVQVTENADGTRTLTAIYPITAWRPGVDTLPPVEVGVEIDGRTLVDTVTLVLTVASVLPPDTAGIEAKPPKDVLGPNWVWWMWLLLGLAVALVVGLLVWWWLRRRRAQPAVVVPELSPRERALRELDAIRAEKLWDRPSVAPFYERASGVLRAYLSDVDPRWSRDRTTSELSAAILPAATPEMAARLRALLREADSVKFANAHLDAATGHRHYDQVRAWIEGFPPVRTAPESSEVAA